MNIGDNFGMIFDGRPVPEFAEPQNPEPTTQQRLGSAVSAARQALTNPLCRGIFREDVDPVALLDTLNINDPLLGSIGTGYIDNPVTNASTSLNLAPPSYTVGPEGELIPVNNGFSGANITISTNPSAAFNAGYGGRYGVDDDVNRAITIIHELGHAANYIYGSGASRIFQNDTGPDLGLVNEINSLTVYRACFEQFR